MQHVYTKLPNAQRRVHRNWVELQDICRHRTAVSVFLNAIPRSAKHYISNSPGVCRREDAFLGKSVVI
jgi:hypothetical protein